MQVGYARKSDESVSSGWWEGEEAEKHLVELLKDTDVTNVWIRTTPDGRAFSLKHNGEKLGPRFLSMPDPSPSVSRLDIIAAQLACVRGEEGAAERLEALLEEVADEGRLDTLRGEPGE